MLGCVFLVSRSCDPCRFFHDLYRFSFCRLCLCLIFVDVCRRSGLCLLCHVLCLCPCDRNAQSLFRGLHGAHVYRNHHGDVIYHIYRRLCHDVVYPNTVYVLKSVRITLEMQGKLTVISISLPISVPVNLLDLGPQISSFTHIVFVV